MDYKAKYNKYKNKYLLLKKIYHGSAKWEEIETDEYKRMVSIFYDEFKNNAEFKNEILGIVKESIKSHPDRPVKSSFIAQKAFAISP